MAEDIFLFKLRLWKWGKDCVSHRKAFFIFKSGQPLRILWRYKRKIPRIWEGFVGRKVGISFLWNLQANSQVTLDIIILELKMVVGKIILATNPWNVPPWNDNWRQIGYYHRLNEKTVYLAAFSFVFWSLS